ncbi:hypothetical protein [Paraburkholderia bengalensis]
MSVTGSQKFAVLLCKFRDTKDTELHPVCFYADLFATNGSGGLNDYWRSASLGAINLDGTDVFGWQTIDDTLANYIATHPDCTDKLQGAIDAFKEVDASKYTAVIPLFNASLGDGGETTGGIVGNPADVNVTWLAHETGHIFGLEHSFDMSDRKAISWSAPGEYYDSYDIMSAMNVDGDSGHQFSPRGPLLNAANLIRMDWIEPDRIWTPRKTNSSATYDVDIVALEQPEINGFLAAKVGGVIIEFRINTGFDAGLARPAVLIHQPAEPNSVIVASDLVHFVNE